MKKICLIIILVGFKHLVYCQQYLLSVSENTLNFKIQTKGDSIFHLMQLKKMNNYYKANGYATFNLDTLDWNYKNKQLNATIFIGKKYTIQQLTILPDTLFLQDKLSLISRYKNNELDTQNIQKLANTILTQLENNGYPFAAVNSNIMVKNNTTSVNLQIDKGAFFIFDTLNIEGKIKVKKSFLEAYTGQKHGKAYNEELFIKSFSKLNQLPFLSSIRNPQMAFVNGGFARPFLYLEKKKADQINGIIGLAPSNTANSNNPPLAFTGEFLLKLNNLFRSGKMLMINWRSFKARSQELKTGFNYPYLLGKPLGIDLALDVLKFDTLFTTLFRQIGFQYYTSGINGLKVFYNVNSTNLNTVDTNAIKTSKTFPATNAISVSQYGVSANFNLLDYRFNPQKGWWIDGFISAGTKQILKDNKIESIRFGTMPNTYNLYDSTTLKTTQYRLKLKADKFIPIAVKSTFKIGIDLEQIVAPQIYFNEVLRVGGINSLKGFNEQSIFATNFNMLEFEYRYLLSTNSHIKAFWNGAYYEDKSFGKKNNTYDTPWGFGLGANLETRAGILSIIYALGKEKGNNFDLRTGKIHFGLSSYF